MRNFRVPSLRGVDACGVTEVYCGSYYVLGGGVTTTALMFVLPKNAAKHKPCS